MAPEHGTSGHPEYGDFLLTAGPRLRAGLVSAHGLEIGIGASSEALAHGWDSWDRLRAMANPVGYLYRVGQSAAERLKGPEPALDRPSLYELPRFEPGLVPALESLTEDQRVCVLLVHAHGWSSAEVAELLDMDRVGAEAQLRRGLARLRVFMEVTGDVG